MAMVRKNEEFGLEAFEEMETFEAHVEAQAEQAAFQEAQEGPPPGTWAAVAWMMAKEYPQEVMDWDAWKDEMKEAA